MSSLKKNLKKSDKQLVKQIKQGNETAFEELFFDYYHDLCQTAVKITNSTDAARDVVQEVFLNIWEKRKTWHVKVSLRAYLYRAVWNRALNFKNKQKNIQQTQKDYAKPTQDNEYVTSSSSSNSKTIIAEIWRVVETMPARRSFVFTLHRKRGLTYKEISKVMNISRKTVENHMGLALKEIRDNIEYKP